MRANNTNRKAIKRQIVIVLAETPIISVMCRKCDVNRSTFYRWLERDSDFRNACEKSINTGVEFINDLAESQLIKKIKEGDFNSTTYWLRHNHIKYDKRKVVEIKPKQKENTRNLTIHNLKKSERKEVGRVLSVIEKLFKSRRQDNP